MQSIELLRVNLRQSRDRTLARVEEMREACVVFPTSNGGCHTLWVLGHLAYIELLVVRTFMLGEPNPLAHWEEVFDGADVSGEIRQYPQFDEVLARCREVRASTLALLESFSEADLDKASVRIPAGFEDTFGTYRLCVQYVADHWYMHRGQLADSRRSAGLERMWV
ncbi:MAG: DinB family protein [Candidatus Eisenbacteria bacterium]|uniref:DinB family protein n=1 Tax=Eiseniibacteriota bacterium TaxID=2212470 RepID=A0A849SHQ8_UNCEI|nr:DinB family protein [Candidatus Eisenbacteria bacterium]